MRTRTLHPVITMANVHPIRPLPQEPTDPSLDLSARAMDNLRFIRETMERAGSFTALSGWGLVVIGVAGLLASWLSGRQHTSEDWVALWIVSAVVCVLIGLLTTAMKARGARMGLLTGPGRKFALSLVPPMFVGAVLTVVLYRAGLSTGLPGTWLMLYGTAIISAGAFSVRAVPLMGVFFLIAGTVALFSPASWGNVWMAAGFGGLHVVFGTLIARRHGG